MDSTRNSLFAVFSLGLCAALSCADDSSSNDSTSVTTAGAGQGGTTNQPTAGDTSASAGVAGLSQGGMPGGDAGAGGQNVGDVAPRPNIILMMADDMGYSDIGAFGGEVSTPNIDALAEDGIRYSRFYNNGRCCPTRATLLTGLYPHQAGLGHMVADGDQTAMNGPGYAGEITERTVTLAEALRGAGYATYMTGKWHVSANEGAEPDNLPNQRGFDRFFGIYNGAANYFTGSAPGMHRLAENNTIIDAPEGFYFTEAISDHAVTYISEHDSDEPFFMYVAYTAPHWPLNALAEDIEKYRGNYLVGWDEIRAERLQRQKDIGLADDTWTLTPRDARAWDGMTAEKQDEMDFRMSIYAAQIDRMDQGIGRIVEALRAAGQLDNTLIIFLSDNGGNHEGGELGSNDPMFLGQPYGWQTGEGTLSYGRAWGNASNTPFRRYKSDTHEGGIATPMIAHWPEGITRSGFDKTYVAHIIDFMPTFLELAGGEYPESRDGHLTLPMEGKSFVSTFKEDATRRDEMLFFEHENNRAVIENEWKLVAIPNGAWELYDLDQDRSEQNDLSAQYPDRVATMSAAYEAWAERTFVHKKTTYALPPTVRLVAPAAASTLIAGTQVELRWGVLWADETVTRLEYDTGSGFTTIDMSAAENGSLMWTVPDEPSDSVVLRASFADGSVSDEVVMRIEAAP